jgi:hypothetical protein
MSETCTYIHFNNKKKFQLKHFDTKLKNWEIETEMQVSLVISRQGLASA